MTPATPPTLRWAPRHRSGDRTDDTQPRRPRGALVQANLIFPTPCEFISPKLPGCAIVRPTLDRNAGGQATIKSFTQDGLFKGQSDKFSTQAFADIGGAVARRTSDVSDATMNRAKSVLPVAPGPVPNGASAA